MTDEAPAQATTPPREVFSGGHEPNGGEIDAWAERPDVFTAVIYGEAIGWVLD